MEETIIEAKTWTELKKHQRKIQGKAVFELTRIESLNNGTFLRVLHQVKPHELVFFDGKQLTHLVINADAEQNIIFFKNGFTFKNCTYALKAIMDENNANV